MNQKHWNVIIIGQGLAGSVLAWELRNRGKSVLIVDRDEKDTSSRVAAGLITPLTGRRIALSWNLEAMLAPAKQFFRSIEERTGRKLLHELAHVRLFENETERQHWERRRQWPEFQTYLHPESMESLLPAPVAPAFGGFAQKDSGYVDVEAFVEATRSVFEKDDAFRREEFTEEAMEFREADGVEIVSWKDVTADIFVFCQGFASAHSRYFDWLPYRSAKGEVLDLEIPSFESNCILNRGSWLLPQGNGKFRAGSTYSWSPLDQQPTEEGRKSILERLRKFIDSDITVTGHRAAVRPIVDQFQCVIGRHPTRPQLAIFNGLGSKGVVKAPWFARQLAEHLVDGRPIENAYDVRRNF